MITWEGTTTAFQAGLYNGGPSGLVYGFIFSWIGTLLQALVMAEMASMIPLAGGQYNWVAILAPPKWSKFLSYMTGWMTVISWHACLASAAFLAGVMIQGLLVLNYESYSFQRWHGTLLFYAVIIFSLFVNTYLARLLPSIESVVLILHIIGFFCILIPLTYLAPHGSAKDVFANFTNAGGWSSDGLSFLIGLATSMFAFIGIDAASHMAEEIENASTVIPMSMCISVLLNGTLGFAMVIALLFCLGDVTKALETTTHFPYIEVYRQATKSNSGASAMASAIIAAMIFACIGVLATASRMTWAFAREKGLPGYQYLRRVEPRTSLPFYSIALCTATSFLLALINIGSSVAFNAMVSLVIASFYSSFLLSAAVLLHKRLTTSNEEMQWGPFKLGSAGVPVIILAIMYSVIGVFFSFFPPTAKVTPETMNWSVVVYFSVIIFSFVCWAVHGRFIYEGPLKEIEIDN